LASSESFLDLRVRELLDLVAVRSPAPGGGSVAALVVGLAAGLAAMAARFAPEEWEARSDAVGRAEALRIRAEPFSDADAAAYARYLETKELDPIVDVPLEIAEIGAEVAEIAARVAVEGNPTVTGDAAAAAVLAGAGARVALRLVELNLGDREDPRRGEAAAFASRAEVAAQRALGSDA
jgi:formiminotetrahydrofolate cyclodeaminase